MNEHSNRNGEYYLSQFVLYMYNQIQYQKAGKTALIEHICTNFTNENGIFEDSQLFEFKCINIHAIAKSPRYSPCNNICFCISGIFSSINSIILLNIKSQRILMREQHTKLNLMKYLQKYSMMWLVIILHSRINIHNIKIIAVWNSAKDQQIL